MNGAWENHHLEVCLDPLNVPATNWYDLTGRVISIGVTDGVPVTGSASQPATLTAVLDDSDHALLPGATSVFSPGWKAGRRIQLYELVGGRRFDEFYGFIQPPETDDWAEAGTDQTITITAVDPLGHLDSARAFVSVATEYILYQGGGALKAHWPLNDPAGSASARQMAASGEADLQLEGFSTNLQPAGMITFGAQGPPGTDDASFQSGTIVLDTIGGIANCDRLTNRTLTPISMVSNQYVALVGWQYLTANPVSSAVAMELSDPTFVNLLRVEYDASTGCWFASVTANGVTIGIFGSKATIGGWDYLAIRINNATGAVDFWVNAEQYTGSTGGTSGGTVGQVIVSAISPGNAAGQVQIYAGDANAFTWTDLQNQQTPAVTRLANQATGDRVTALAQYAGLTTADLDVDQGVAVMQQVSLASKTPIAAMREAETTEQGVLATKGSRITFRARSRRYNS